MTGCLLLILGVLTLLAPPVESHDPLAHPLPGAGITLDANSAHGHPSGLSADDFFGGDWTAIHPKHFEIQWIRIYKNPKTTPLAELTIVSDYKKVNTTTNHVITPPGFPKRRARLFPSLWKEYEEILDRDTTLAEEEANYFWVDIHPANGELYPDPEKPGNSGLVTDSEHTTVVPGDTVAIAINVKLTYYKAAKEPTNNMGEWRSDDTARTGIFAPSSAKRNRLPLSRPGEEDPWAPEPSNVWTRNWADGDLKKTAGGAIIGALELPTVEILNPNGETAATAFGMEWWASESDARNGLPPLTQNQERPEQVFLPEVPQPNTGEFQDGIVAITVPEIHVAEEDFYGQIIIYQV